MPLDMSKDTWYFRVSKRPNASLYKATPHPEWENWILVTWDIYITSYSHIAAEEGLRAKVWIRCNEDGSPILTRP